MIKTFYITIVFMLFSGISHAQYTLKNYSNAEIDKLPIVKEIANWIQYNQIDNVIPLLANKNIIDQTYLDSETTFLSLEYTRDRIDSNTHTTVVDDRNIVWYERNFYKNSKSKLKPRYQIYFTVEFSNDSYRIIDLRFGKKKKINTSEYDTN
ncbi:hypothetical protein [Bizionia sp. M204]|uniref:hypothetical protein n=1 Tax=Bizionia sp. M204 TaxID=2675331 RepID=UPI0020599C24|nr:hypothetical protein [Bizionia sp. M204]UPS91994.1 hypothetical protein GMA17_09795 [Bizionia sp. M204]